MQKEKRTRPGLKFATYFFRDLVVLSESEKILKPDRKSVV